MQVVLENQSTTLRPHIRIYSATKSQLSEKYDGTAGAGLDFMFDVEPGKDIYVQIVPNGSIGRYRLMVRALGQKSHSVRANQVVTPDTTKGSPVNTLRRRTLGRNHIAGVGLNPFHHLILIRLIQAIDDDFSTRPLRQSP